MSDGEKIQHCLRLIVLLLFDLKLRLREMEALQFSHEARKEIEATHNDVIDEEGEVLLQQFFRGLRRQAGAVVDEVPRDLASASSDDVWSALRRADRQGADAEFLDREWKQFWDAL